MSEKRRDNKGRILRQGELQRSDGKYEYRYADTGGERRSVYSWRLVNTDKEPKGKRRCEALRDMEKSICRDMEDGIDCYGARHITLDRFFETYIGTKCELKPTTRANYQYMYSRYIGDKLGSKNIGLIKFSDIRKLYVYLIQDVGLKLNSLCTVHSILHPVFTVAVRDGLVRTNPTDGMLVELKRSAGWEPPKRHALTETQQAAFMGFVKNSEAYNCWAPILTVLLGTGCRIGEVVGLRWQDCDFKGKMININHSLVYRKPEEDGKYAFYVSTPKTRAGVRMIPMLSAVKRVLLDERERQMRDGGNKTAVDGYSGFIFASRDGNVMFPGLVNRAIRCISAAYNKMEMQRAETEGRKPELLPHFTAHNLRHTFCTRFCENETNLKIIQEIMGHANISTTMDVYNEATKTQKKESFAALDGKLNIG